MSQALRFGSSLLGGPSTRDMHAGEKPPRFRYTACRWGAHFLSGAAADYGCRCLTIFTTAGPANLMRGEAMRNREETAALLSSQWGLRAQVWTCACPGPAALSKPPQRWSSLGHGNPAGLRAATGTAEPPFLRNFPKLFSSFQGDQVTFLKP